MRLQQRFDLWKYVFSILSLFFMKHCGRVTFENALELYVQVSLRVWHVSKMSFLENAFFDLSFFFRFSTIPNEGDLNIPSRAYSNVTLQKNLHLHSDKIQNNFEKHISQDANANMVILGFRFAI